MPATLYEKYGGFKSVSRVVMRFYEYALDSDQIGDHFENVDMAKLIDHQTKFISYLLGGPASISDDRLKQVHAHLGISHRDFDEAVTLLGDSLGEHGFSEPDIGKVVEAIETKRTLVVTRDDA